MPSAQVICEADAAAWYSPAYGAGLGNHLPVGTWGSARYRAIMRFPVPAGWSSMLRITGATLNFWISDFNHVGVRNSQIYCRRQNPPLWSKAAGSTSCESGFSGSNTTQWTDIAAGISATDQVQFSSGTTANRLVSLNVTAIVEYYRANGTPKIVFCFDEVSTSDYTEIWSTDYSAYNPSLDITYESNTPPNAPTLNSPAAGETVVSTTPTFAWTHNDPQGDPQANANVAIWDASGTTQLYSWYPTVGSNQSLVAPVALTRGTTYQWSAQTNDASGGGPYSAKQSFTIKALPVVTIDATRYMVFANGAPRLQVNWSVAGGTQATYRVQSSAGYDSGVLSGTATSHVLSTQAVVDNVAQTITVTITTADSLSGSANRSFTPRYGLTVHRRDLGAAPVNWGTPSVAATVPSGASLVIEYGSSATATATPSPNVWYSALSAVPKARYVFYRAWLIPSASAGPSLDAITIPSDATAAALDKWGTTKDTPGLVAPWGVDTGEYVYGSRSITADVSGAGPFKVYSYGIKVRAGRSYILTGLMKSQGNSGAQFQLHDAAGVLTGGGYTMPVGPMQTAALVATTDWFTANQRDVNRYKTPTWVADADKTVWVVLLAGGTAGAKAWFDAIKLEESTVATPWTPGAVGATVIDAGGVQVDASKGGVFRLRGSAGGLRDTVEAGSRGLLVGGDTLLYSPSAGDLMVGDDAAGVPAVLEVAGGTAGNEGGEFHLLGAGANTDWYIDNYAGTLRVMTAAQVRAVIQAASPHLALTGDLSFSGFLLGGGTSFPGTPPAGGRFWRTDLRMEFFWSGVYWLSTQLYMQPIPIQMAFDPISANTSVRAPWPHPTWAIWVEQFWASTYVASANSGTVYWNITCFSTTISTISNANGAVVIEVANVNANWGPSSGWVQADFVKVGTPGPMYVQPMFSYRLVAP